MKKFVSLIMISLLLVLSCAFLAQAAAKKKNVAIIEFSNATRYPRLGAAVAETLTVELVKNKQFHVIERAKLKKILKEQYLSLTGAIDPNSSSVSLGKLKGVDYLITGAVLRAEQSDKKYGLNVLSFGQNKSEVEVSIRLIDVKTGSVIMAEKAVGKVKAESFNYDNKVAFQQFRNSGYGLAAQKAVKNVIDKLNEISPIEGFVVKTDGDKVIIDLGKQDGIEKGNKFEVFVEGALIKHPVTGKILGAERIKKGLLEVEEVLGNMSVCKLKKKSKTVLQSGDKVVRKY